jgi:L-fucose mutarotase
MLKSKLLHPDILQVLGSAGHGSKILIADGNYPFTTGAPSLAKRVFLNLMPGIPKVTDVLEAVISAIPIESAEVMIPPDDGAPKPAIHAEFRSILGADVPLKELKRYDFYETVKKGETQLVIATAEQRRFANILITIGVVKFS